MNTSFDPITNALVPIVIEQSNRGGTQLRYFLTPVA